MVAVHLAYWERMLVAVAVGLVAMLTAAGIFIYVFLYKLVSHFQSRLGPMEAGPHGTLQIVADLVKSLQKEDIFPSDADRTLFALAPIVSLVSVFLVFVVIPIGPALVASNLDVGLLYAAAVGSISVLGVLMAGWGSANKFALIGAVRAAGQLLAYELPLLIVMAAVAVQAGTMSLPGIVSAQIHGSIFSFHGLGFPFLLTQALGLVVFLIAAQAETFQTPFDMPIAEAELVAGFQVEYTGVRFLVFFMSEVVGVFVLSALAATMFLGGWYIPGLGAHSVAANVFGPVALLAKATLLAGLSVWARFSWPRLREDQLQSFAWKVLIPLSLLNLLATGIFKVAL